MLKKFFSSKKNKREETEAPPKPASKESVKIVIKKRTPAKVAPTFRPPTPSYNPDVHS